MDYKKKYEQALERARQVHTTNVDENKKSTEYIFPELKESEDERIRKAIYELVRQSSEILEKKNQESMLAWLEKQGEQNPANKVEPKFKVGDWIIQKGLGIYKIVEVCDSWYEVISYNDGIQYSIGFDKESDCYIWTIQDAKDGDVLYSPCLKLLWIFKSRDTLYCGCNLNYNDGAFCEEGYFERPTDEIPATKEQHDFLFKKMKEAGYEWDTEKKELKKIEQNPTNEVGNYDHKEVLQTIINEQKSAWSEEDEPQKELAETYLAVFDKKFPILPTLEGKKLADYKNFLNKCQQILGLKYWSIRPLQAKLFEKLSLLWAAWGAEHLKSLGQTNEDTDNKNHAWSEEDEQMLQKTISTIMYALSIPFGKEDDPYFAGSSTISWLKSIKDRYTWKPSDEQMKALEYYIEKDIIDKEGIFGRHIIELYAQLKKLK